MEIKLQPHSGSTYLFVKNTHQQVASLALRLILAVKPGYIESFEVCQWVELQCGGFTLSSLFVSHLLSLCL